MKDIFNKIQKYNEGRIPHLLNLKYEKMSKNPFAFFRGSCPLFYKQVSKDDLKSPHIFITGDLHLENFGTYKGSDREIYFDINDFDESIKAPIAWELVRVLTSIILASKEFGITESESVGLCYHFLQTWSKEIQNQKEKSLDREDSKGIIKKLMDSIHDRKRSDFIDKNTKDGKIILEKNHRLEVQEEAYKLIEKTIHNFSTDFKVKDIAFRVAGCGSLGLERYMVYVESKEREKEYILDIKESSTSCLNEFVTKQQISWPNEAERIVHVQQLMQPHPPFLLDTLEINDKWFVIRELQPTGDKVNLEKCEGDLKIIEKFIEECAKILAWSNLRCSNSLKIVKYSKDETNFELITKAIEYSKDFQNYHKEFREEYLKHKNQC